MKSHKRKPRHFGGWGGIWGGRPLNELDSFEMAAAKAMGARVRSSDNDAGALWGALANVDWSNRNGDTAGYSFRAAGDVVAAIVGGGVDYMDYYCQATDGIVPGWIATAMRKLGWTAKPAQWRHQRGHQRRRCTLCLKVGHDRRKCRGAQATKHHGDR